MPLMQSINAFINAHTQIDMCINSTLYDLSLWFLLCAVIVMQPNINKTSYRFIS